MATQKNLNKNLSATDFLDLICYNLAQFSYTEKRFSSIKNISNYDVCLDTLATRLQLTAKYQLAEIEFLTKEKEKATTSSRIKEIENKIKEIRKTPYEIYWVAKKFEMAKYAAKHLLLLGEFEILLADAAKEAFPTDSVAGIDLLGSNSKISNHYSSHYQEVNSVGPLIDSITTNNQASQSRVEALLSLAKPEKSVFHQVWLNDHLMIKSAIGSHKSFYEYVTEDQKKLSDLFYLIAYATEIEKKANGQLTQQFINNEIKQLRLEHLKREGEKYMEQYALITVELFGQLIKNRKKTSPAAQNSPLYENLNLINGIKAPFSPQDMIKMKEYLTIRDHLAHPSEFNLRPMGNQNQQNLLSHFVSDMTNFLANLLNINKSDIQAKINSFKEEEVFDVRALISLMDSRKALRDICVQKSGLSPSTQDIFVTLGIIDKNENKILSEALDLRNTLCHGKIDYSLAQQAEEKAIKCLPIVNKIASTVEQKYGVSLKNYYQPSSVTNGISLSDFQSKFPFINTSFETDPDKELFEKALDTKSSEKIDLETIQKLHAFSLITYDFIKNKDKTTPCPYIENEFIPFAKEIDQLGKNPESDELPNLKQLVTKGILKAFAKGYQLPTLKSENQNS